MQQERMALKLKGELTEESYKQSGYVESIESRAVVLQVSFSISMFCSVQLLLQ
jgi:hypothetical protein